MRVFRIAISALILGTVGADAASRPSVIDLGLLSSRGIGKPSSSASQSKAGATEMRLSAVGGKSDFPFVAAYTAMSNVGPDKGLTRSALDAQIFKMAAPAVVLVVTKDGLGSGSLISRDGTILTNYHVVRGFDTVAVLFKPAIEGADPRPEDAIAATVTKINETKDLALIRVAIVPPNVSPLKLGTLSAVDVGGDVHAIGHPEGRSWTFTKGIVSQIRQDFSWSSDDKVVHQATVIQTQTPISPGNSGGPLLDDQGALVGVNSFYAGEGQNLNYAVSVSDVQSVLGQSGNVFAQAAPASNGKSCEPKILYKGESADKQADIIVMDVLCTGRANATGVFPRNQSAAEMLLFYEIDPDHAFRVLFAPTRNERWEYSISRRDVNKDWELVCYHQNSSVEPSRCEPYSVAMARK